MFDVRVMATVFHPATERGHANHGWLDSHHSFSFANWYDPEKTHFGALRVLNDDIVRGGEGFGTHPHDNMEIVSIPLKGTLAHKDSTESKGIIEVGDVQIMSAGTGIQHSEYNASRTEDVQFLQIWVFPKVKNISPRYDQKKFEKENRKNKWQILVSPNSKDEGLWINQDAVFSRIEMTENTKTIYSNHFEGHGVYFFVIEGSVEINGHVLNKRDAIGVSGVNNFELTSLLNSDVLAIEIPM